MDNCFIKVNSLFWGPSHPHLGLAHQQWLNVAAPFLPAASIAHQKLEVGALCTSVSSAALDISEHQLLVQGPGLKLAPQLMLAPQSLAEEWT